MLRLTNDMLNCIEITVDELMKCTETFKTRKEKVTVELVCFFLNKGKQTAA